MACQGRQFVRRGFEPAQQGLEAICDGHCCVAKPSRRVKGRGPDPHLVKSLFDDAMKAFATIEATMPQLEAAMSPYVELRN